MTAEQQEAYYIKLLRDMYYQDYSPLYNNYDPQITISRPKRESRKSDLLPLCPIFCYYCSCKESVLPGLSWLELVLLCNFASIGWRRVDNCPHDRQFGRFNFTITGING